MSAHSASATPARTRPRGAGRRWVRRVAAGRHRISPDGWALVALVVTVVVANLPYVLGFFDPNPLPRWSDLGVSVTPGLLAGQQTLDANVGYTAQALGHLAALTVLHGHLPWWNPYEVTGMPLLGEAQAAAFFPPTLLTAFSGGQLYEHMLLELTAGICTYFLLRRLRVVRWAAFAGAVAFALNGTFAWFAHATVNPVPFLPMLLLGIERAFSATRAGRRGGWRLLALAGALSLYAGFPEVTYIEALMAICWLGWRCCCLERRLLRTFLVKAALGGVAATLLAAPILVAIKNNFGHAFLGSHANGYLGSLHFPGYALPQLFMPYIYGEVDGKHSQILAQLWSMAGGYLSTSLLLFALLGLFARGRRGLRIVMLAWIVLVFARMYGQPPLVGHIISALPGMSKLQFYRYATSALALSVIVLAALGLDDLARVPEHRLRALWGAVAVGGAVFAAALGTRPVFASLAPRSGHGVSFAASIAWGALVPAVAAAVALLRAPRARAALLGLLVAADALLLFMVPEFAARRAQTTDLAPVAYLRQHLGDARFFTLGPIQPNYGSYFRLGSANVNDFPPQIYANYMVARLDDAAWPPQFTGSVGGGRVPPTKQELLRHLSGFREADVRYVLTPAGFRLPRSPATFTLAFRSRTTWIYRLAGTSSYFSAAGCRVTFNQRETAHVGCTQTATLTRRETWFPGWTARVDGHPAPIRQVDGLFQAVTVPPGSHQVAFSFAPPGMNWALIGAVGACALMVVGPRLRGPRRRRVPSPGAVA